MVLSDQAKKFAIAREIEAIRERICQKKINS
jgi:hypothetical protein